MSRENQYLGIVENGEFVILSPTAELTSPGSGSVRTSKLTIHDMTVAQPLETGQLDLTEYEGCAIMVRGYFSGDWICNAQVIDKAEPILTTVVQEVFGMMGKQS